MSATAPPRRARGRKTRMLAGHSSEWRLVVLPPRSDSSLLRARVSGNENSRPTRGVERGLLHIDPLKPCDLDALQARQQRRHVPLAFIPEDLRRRDGPRGDVMRRIIVDAEIKWITRAIHVSPVVLAVSLRAKQIELTRPLVRRRKDTSSRRGHRPNEQLDGAGRSAFANVRVAVRTTRASSGAPDTYSARSRIR